jgi:hypothetical protein
MWDVDASTSTCCGAATPNPIRATSSLRAIGATSLGVTSVANGGRDAVRCVQAPPAARRSVRVFWGVRYRTTAGGTRSLTRIPCGVLQLVVDKREDAFDVCRAATESISELSW